MSKFSDIFNVFSRRIESAAETSEKHVIPETFRNRVLLWCREVFSNERTDYGEVYNATPEFWSETHRFLMFLHGRPLLSGNRPAASPPEESIRFLLTCSGENFLDFLEHIFKLECLFHVALPQSQMVEELNGFFRVDNLPYHLTDFVTETVREFVDFPYRREADVTKTLAYPRIIARESEIVHTQATEPVLRLLEAPHFSSANSEFLGALEDFRKGELGDSLTKCGSAFESVMKILCDRKGWAYTQRDTAATLVTTIVDNTQLENYFQQLLIIVATLRNRLSSSHGAGVGSRNPPRHVVQYALNATASAILLLVQETGEG